MELYSSLSGFEFLLKAPKLSLFFLENAIIEFKTALSIFCSSRVSSACHLSDFGFKGLVPIYKLVRLRPLIYVLYGLYVIEKTRRP